MTPPHRITAPGRTVLVTGSSGHLGRALVRTLREQGHHVVGLDLTDSPHTTATGSITDHRLVRACLRGADTVLHTATLHKPHIATHDQQAFIDTNITGTRTLLEQAVQAGVSSFVFTSTTSTFGHTTHPGQPAAWITEDTPPQPKNIYGITKLAAENLCALAHRDHGLPLAVLRTSRFFPGPDPHPGHTDANVKANEHLHRRVDLHDAVDAHLLAARTAPQIGFGRYIISATTPFHPDDRTELGHDAAAAVRRLFPDVDEIYARKGWTLFPRLDRVYDNHRARTELGWRPRHDFRHVLDRLAAESARGHPAR